MKKLLQTFISFSLVIALSLSSLLTVKAADQVTSNDTKNNSLESIQDTEKKLSEFVISEDIQKQINRLSNEDPSNKDYLDFVIENFYEDVHTNSSDLNQLLAEAIVSLDELNEVSDTLYMEVVEKQEELIKNSPKQRAAWQDLYISAMGDYSLGMALVRQYGCPNTANYMEHAIVPMDKVYTSWTPDDVYHSNDTWAQTLAYNEFFTDEIFAKFEREILALDKSYGVVSGSFAFTTSNSSLDAFAALHNVNYSVTFTKKTNGYSTTYKITDVYDFAWGNYENFAVGFGNNYCYMMQSNGWIKPFKIVITANA